MIYVRTVILKIHMSGKKLIKSPEIIAEIASTHNGSKKILEEIVTKLIKDKIRIVKFQIFKNNFLCHKSSKYYSGLKKIEISQKKWKRIINKYKKKIKIILEPFDEQSYFFCKKFKNDVFVKISSSENDNFGMIFDSLKNFKKVFFNISGKSENEVLNFLKILRKYRKKIVLLYGYQNFPTKLDKIRFDLIKKIYKKKFIVGYADHSSSENLYNSYNASIISLLLGAQYLEKHITIDRKKKLPDFISSLEHDEFVEFSNFFKSLESYKKNRKISFDEEKYAVEMGKHAVTTKKINKGQILNKEDLVFLRIKKRGVSRAKIFDLTKMKKVVAKIKLKKNQVINLRNIRIIKN